MNAAVSGIRETPEQSGIVHSKAHIIIANAFAGTGKTSTLVSFALHNPTASILYLVFNKALEVAAAGRFPSNVTVKTVNSLAYGNTGAPYKDKIVPFLRVPDITQVLGLKNNYTIGQRVLSTLNSFLVSDREKISDIIEQGTPGGAILCELTEALWKIMKDPTDKRIGMLHDGYVKLYQLSHPRFSVYNKTFNVVLLDEAQDTNPVTADMVARQDCQKVYVGDRHQQIYLFRGASNAMQGLAGEQHSLTNSFRFGHAIAAVANTILRNKGERLEVTGLGKKGVVGFVDERRAYTCICRTNSNVFTEAINAKRSISFVGGIKGYKFDMIEDAYNLSARNYVKDSYIKSFASFQVMEKMSEDTDDAELKMLVKVVNDYGVKIPELIESVRNRTVEQGGHVLFTTAHKAKGLEWDQVKMTDDFIKIDKYRELRNGDLTPLESAELDTEMNLLYVAATRSTNMLQATEDLRKHI